MALKVNGILVAGLGTNGAGVPSGGEANQILQKNSSVDYDTSWVDMPFIATKTSELENDADFTTTTSVDEKLQIHRNNTELHTNAEEREYWNNKQEKNVIVSKGSDGLATMSASEIWAAVQAGAAVYYSASTAGGTLHPFLEGAATVAFFYSAYVDNDRIQGTGILIDDNKNITTSSYSSNHLKNNTIHITANERELWNGANAYTDTSIANLVNSAPETLNTLGELATAFQENKEVVDVLDEAITTKADADYVEALYQKLNSDMTLRFYCVEDVEIITNGVSKTYPANSNVEVKFIETDTYEIIPTSDNSILALNGFPGALGTYYPWLEGVKQFSNILFDMNNEDMYTKWNQNNQGQYQVQFAQYINCIFWSDMAYVHEITKRTNYTLYYSSQLPLCYSSNPANTFRAFFLAFGVNSDPNWGNRAYRDSFAQATWATQAFSYYGARTIGVFGHDSSDFNIVLPPDCRGLMYGATAVENAGTFDATNVTNFGAKSGSWRDAFGECISLKNLYIKNLNVNLNISWSPIDYDSIYFIIENATNTDAITISVSPYTYYLLSPSDFELATSKNITIELLTTNYVEDNRLNQITNKADKTEVENAINTANTYTDTALVTFKDSLTPETWTFTMSDGTVVTKQVLLG